MVVCAGSQETNQILSRFVFHRKAAELVHHLNFGQGFRALIPENDKRAEWH